MTDDPLLTYDQVAARLTVTPRTIQSLVYRGALRSVKIGGARRIPQSVVDKFIADGLAAASGLDPEDAA